MANDNMPKDIWEKVAPIEGWLSFSAAHFTWALLKYQQRIGLSGPVVELGVYKAKYLSLLAAATSEKGLRICGFDGFFAGYNRPLEKKWIASARQMMTGNVESVCPCADRLEIIHANTLSLTAGDLIDRSRGRPGFVSVDAGHDAEDVLSDMTIVADALADGGIIAADDVFNAVVPGVAEGFCRFMERQSSGKVVPFATVGNKVFLTTRPHHADYLRFTKEFIFRTEEDYARAARKHAEDNQSIGHVPRFFGNEIVPFFS